MFGSIEKTFNDISRTLESNREEIKDMAYSTQMNKDVAVMPEEQEFDEE
jgi:hypothetical protein